MATTPTLMDRLKATSKPLTDKFDFSDFQSAGPGLAAIQQNVNQYKSATAPASSPVLPVSNTPSPTDLVNPNAQYGSRPGEKRLKLSVPTQGLGGIR